MTNPELQQENNNLIELVRELSQSESMTATEMFFWGVALSVIGVLLVVLVKYFIEAMRSNNAIMLNNLKSELSDQFTKIEENHNKEIEKITTTLVKHDQRIGVVERKVQ